MDGGSLSVPSDKLNDFYDMCVKTIRTGEPIYIVEQRSEIYNFFLDLDHKAPEAVPFEKIEKITRLICDKVSSLGGHECLVSISKPKPSGNLIKSGIHMNWSNFPVNSVMGLRLRSHIINILEKMMPSFNWEKIVDKAVHTGKKGSGFRMPWSHKKQRHTECKGKGCLVCENTGKLIEPPYLPVFRYRDGALEPIDFMEPSVDVLKESSIRTEITESIEIPEPPVITEDEKPRVTQPMKVLENAELLEAIENYVKKYVPGQGSAKLTRMSESKTTFAISTTSQYCENVKREHVSNHVWFSIYQGKITQKCFDEGCKDFTSKSYMLTPSVLKLLYPNSNANTFIGSGFNGSGVVHSKKYKSSQR